MDLEQFWPGKIRPNLYVWGRGVDLGDRRPYDSPVGRGEGRPTSEERCMIEKPARRATRLSCLRKGTVTRPVRKSRLAVTAQNTKGRGDIVRTLIQANRSSHFPGRTTHLIFPLKPLLIFYNTVYRPLNRAEYEITVGCSTIYM